MDGRTIAFVARIAACGRTGRALELARLVAGDLGESFDHRDFADVAAVRPFAAASAKLQRVR